MLSWMHIINICILPKKKGESLREPLFTCSLDIVKQVLKIIKLVLKILKSGLNSLCPLDHLSCLCSVVSLSVSFVFFLSWTSLEIRGLSFFN